MKTYLYIILLSALFSCKKNANVATNPEISFKADGVAYSFKGDWDYSTTKGCTFDPTFFTSLGYISFVGRTSTDLAFEADIYDAKVEVKTYNTVKFDCILNTTHYTYSKNCSLIITKIENNRASGTFSGKVYTTSSSTVPVDITSGVFKDVLLR